MYDMPAVRNKKLVALLLEEALPDGCVVEGVDFNASEEEPACDSLQPFLQRYEDIALRDLRERSALTENLQRDLADYVSGSPLTSTKQGADENVTEKKQVSS